MLASDALHFYEELALDRPFDIFIDLSAMYTSDILAELGASGGTSIVPGHDPEVMARFPALNDRVKDLAVRIGSDRTSGTSPNRALYAPSFWE